MKKNIRILQYGALTTNKGGIESYIISQLRHINKNIFKYDFLIAKDSPLVAYEKEVKSYGCNIYREYIPWGKSFFGHYFSLYKFFKKNSDKYDIVITNIVDFYNINILIMAKLFVVKFCIAHSHMSYDLRRKFLRKILVNINRKIFAPKFCDYLFACSENAAEWMFGNKLWHNKGVLIVKNGIEYDKFKFNTETRDLIRKNLKIENKMVLGHTGKFLDQKNHNFIIDIFEEIHKMYPQTILLLIGQGPLEEQMKNKVLELKLENSVKFLGMRDDVNELLQAMDIFLFPSKYEGLPVSLIEAQAAGLKCFVSDEVISKEVVITDLVEFISLNKGPKFWAKKILDLFPYKRKNQLGAVMKAGYDIKSEIKTIEKFFIKIVTN